MIMADTETNRALRKERTGIVVSSAMQKTIVVRVERTTRHPLYGKEMTQAKKYHAHDEENTAKVGDRIIAEGEQGQKIIAKEKLDKLFEGLK